MRRAVRGYRGAPSFAGSRELATRGIVTKEQLLLRLGATSLDEAARRRIRDHIERDFR